MSGVFLLLSLLSSTALAQDEPQTPPTAEQDYARAIRLYSEGKNRESLQAFNDAISKSSDPVYRCNRAAVLRVLGEHPLAIEDLTICRDTYQMSELEKGMIDAQLQALSIVEYHFSPRSEQIAKQIANPPEVIVKKDTDTSKPVPPPVIAKPKPSSPLRSLAWVSLGTGVGALIGAGALEIANRDDVNSFRTTCLEQRDGGSYDASCSQLQSSLKIQQRLSRSLFIAGGALSITSVILMLVSQPRSPQDSPKQGLSITPDASPESVKLKLKYTF